MIKIDKNIPIADRTHRGNMPKTKIEYPWSSMELDDSFFIPANGEDIVRLMNKITASGRGYFGVGCVSARSVVENNELGVRVWRIS